jgi:uncharacterized protein YfaS (alpha-2-macroglobulin family)
VGGHVDWGSYRLEVFDPATGAASSFRFYAGWYAAPGTSSTPDKLQVSTDKGTAASATSPMAVEGPLPAR